MSVVLHVAIAVMTMFMLMVAMLPLFNGVFNIEPDRIGAARIIYFCLIFSTMITVINVPYDAVLNAHENMLFFSVVGIFESLLKLGVAFACIYMSGDKLVLYGTLMACIPVITLIIMLVYCHRHYEECVIAPRKYWDGSLVKQISTFFGWNFFTAISSLFSAQGVGIVLNHFFGTVLNASQGIAHQVNGALSNFSLNMMKALNPVIVKSAGAGNIVAMNRATLAGCKFSSLLTMFFAVPLSIEIQYILGIWLKEVPDWAATFVVLQLVQSIITQMASSASTAVYAKGDIKGYAIWKSVMNAMPVILTWIAFCMGAGPIWLYIPMIIVWAIGGNIVIIYYAKRKCGLAVNAYVSNVVLPLACTAIVMVLLGVVSYLTMDASFLRLVITCVATTIGVIVSAFLFAMTKEEKAMAWGVIENILKRKGN